MFSDEAMEIIQSHEDKIDMLQRRLYGNQMDLIKALQDEWAALNVLIREGKWDESAVFRGNCYGLKIGQEQYVLQLDEALPFIPNTYYRSFQKTFKEFYATKSLLSLQLRDVIERIGDGYMRRAATLFVRHYYHNRRMFDLDNKAKQVIINTLRGVLIKEDNVNYLTCFLEDAMWDDRKNRTMLYLCPYEKQLSQVTQMAEEYPRIDNAPGVIIGKIPERSMPLRPPSEDSIQVRKRRSSRKGIVNDRKGQEKSGKNKESFV